jgi:hypothetical protein
MIKLAPIALFCFKRLDTLESCVESLKMCPESINTDLIIFSDEARNKGDTEKVNEIRNYLTKITGFKTLRIIHREENYGVDYNIIRGIQQMAQEYESFIIVEDDLVVSNQFLRFMNAGLKHFKSFEKVLTLSAFNYVKIPKNYVWDCYFTHRTNPWGWATWSDKIKDVDWDLALTNNFLSNPAEIKTFNLWGSDRSRMLKRTLNNEIRAWDIRLDYYQFKKNLLSAFACKNLVINNGFNSEDASNTTGYNRFKVCLEYFNLINFHFPNFIPYNPIVKRRFITKNSIFNRLITMVLKKIYIKN